MNNRRSGLRRLLTTLMVASLAATACAGDDDTGQSGADDPTTSEAAGGEGDPTTPDSTVAATGAPYTIGWLTDASSVTRGTYFPEYEGAKLFFETLNAEGGINGRPVEIMVEDINIDQEAAVTLSTKLAEDPEVLMLAGGTIEGRQPAIYEVVRDNELPFLSGHSARPDMFPTEPDPWLFTAGNVFEAMSDARVELWSEVFGDEGGSLACYIHEAPAAAAVCDRWFEGMEEDTNWTGDIHINAPLQTSDFSSIVQPVVEQNPDIFFDISIASHAIGVAVAARSGGYTNPIVFSMTATPETDIQQVVDQVGGEDLYAISNITSIDETDVPEIQRILDAAEQYGTEIPPNSATVNGWLMGMMIADSLERCGEDCDRTGLRDALESMDIDTKGLTGGPVAFSPEDHVGMRYWTGYQYNTETSQLERAMDGWVEFDATTDLREPLATE